MLHEDPHDMTAEFCLIGCCLLEPGVIDDVVEAVGGVSAFHNQRHRTVFSAIQSVHESSGTLDLVMLRRHMEDEGTLATIGGDDALAEFANGVPVATNWPHYAKSVARKAQQRLVLQACEAAAFSIRSASTGETEEVIASSAEAVIAAAMQSDRTPDVSLNVLLEQSIEELGKTTLSGLRLPLRELADRVGDLVLGEYTVVGARPSMGKTAFGMQCALSLGRVAPGAFYSIEMPAATIAHRILAGLVNTTVTNIRQNRVDHMALAREVIRLGDIPVTIDATNPLTLQSLTSKVRRMVARKGIQWVVIDYLQYMNSPPHAKEGRRAEIEAISRGLKTLAKNQGIHVICLAQLNRGVEGRSENRPRMSDLRESGAIEQDGDNILLLHREAYYHKGDVAWMQDNPTKIDEAEVIVDKCRNGETCSVTCKWNGPSTRFEDRDAGWQG
jgi:replicative DNA helicase